MYVALIAIGIAVWRYPMPEFRDLDAGNGVPYSHIVNLRPVGIVGAISIFMHLLCRLFNFKYLAKWSFSILVPTSLNVGGHYLWMSTLAYDERPRTVISPTEALVFNLVLFTIGFVAVVVLLDVILPKWFSHPANASEESANN